MLGLSQHLKVPGLYATFCSWQDGLCPIATQGCQVAKTFYLPLCCGSANRTLLSCHPMTLVQLENRIKNGMLSMSLDRLTSHAGHYATDYREHYVLWIPDGLEMIDIL